MRHWPFLLILSLMACVPGNTQPLSLHDVSLYGIPETGIYSFFYGGPTSLTVDNVAFTLSEGAVQDPFAVTGALLVNNTPYLQRPLPPLTTQPFAVGRVPLSSDLTLRTSEALGTVVYFDGSRWFTLAERAAAGLNTRIVPRPRLEGLRGLGQLTAEEARTLERVLAARAPVAVGVLLEPRVRARTVAGVENYRQTALIIQTDIPVDQSATPDPIRELVWSVLASGQNAVPTEGRQFVLANTQAQLVSLWNQAYGTALTPPPLPQVNFERESVVGMFLGVQPTGGYGIDVRGLTLEGGDVYVNLVINEPGPGAITTQSLTNPWVFVRVNRPNLAVTWFRNARNNELVGAARRVF